MYGPAWRRMRRQELHRLLSSMRRVRMRRIADLRAAVL
jgi:hypothetical protein